MRTTYKGALVMGNISRSCKEFIELYKDARVNCASCKYWNGTSCNEIERVTAAHEKEHEFWDRQMRSNKSVFIE